MPVSHHDFVSIMIWTLDMIVHVFLSKVNFPLFFFFRAFSFMKLYGKRSFSVTTPCASPTRVNTERLAERETLLHRLGSKLNRTVLNSCGNPIIRTGNNT